MPLDPIAFTADETASEADIIMAVRHRELPIAAVQFHPESILTLKDDLGLRLIAEGNKKAGAMIRIYGIRQKLDPIKAELSDVINACMVEALSFPDDKRAHRFFPMAKEDFYYPAGRTDAYIVIEVNMIQGRSQQARKKLIHLLFVRIKEQLGIDPNDVEVVIFESPACNFGFRGHDRRRGCVGLQNRTTPLPTIWCII